jgi:hypothetical protein
MSQKIVPGIKILLDADVLFHFLFASELSCFMRLFNPGCLIMLDIVYKELTVRKNYKIEIDNLINFRIIEIIEFPQNVTVFKTFASLKKSGKGLGESACMAVALHNGYALASSNLSDVHDYCSENNIINFTTMDLLYLAYKYEIISESDCENFISAVKGKKGIMKFTMKAYIEMVNNGHRKTLLSQYLPEIKKIVE